MPETSPSREPHLFADGIRDNRIRGRVADFLRDKIAPQSLLRFVSAYFTIHAYDALRAELDAIEKLRFLFGEPGFVASLDPERSETKVFRIESDELRVRRALIPISSASARTRTRSGTCARWCTA